MTSDWVLSNNHHFIALNKPVGIPTLEDKTGDKSLLDLGEIYCKTTLYAVHRLDRTVSGIVIFAKNVKILNALNVQFQEHIAKKSYWAIVGNRPPKDADTLIHFLKKDGRQKMAKVVSEKDAEAQQAELRYTVKASSEKYFLLEIELITGRFHQIRVQLAAIGCPVKGDVKYGFRRSNADRSVHLHAHRLELNHPVSNEKMVIEAPAPTEVLWDFFTKPTQVV
jgi:23S rRNA pseudouridine1911/1915/1917 synthase